jgi:hypothetical protein
LVSLCAVAFAFAACKKEDAKPTEGSKAQIAQNQAKPTEAAPAAGDRHDYTADFLDS